MTIEIKGLKAQAILARKNLDALNIAYTKFNEAAPVHASEVGKMATDLGEMQSDLEFATNLMGNSAGESEKLAKDHGEKKVVSIPDVTKINHEPVMAQQTASQEVADIASQTFRAAE
jgi:hypothetical protein